MRTGNGIRTLAGRHIDVQATEGTVTLSLSELSQKDSWRHLGLALALLTSSEARILAGMLLAAADAADGKGVSDG